MPRPIPCHPGIWRVRSRAAGEDDQIGDRCILAPLITLR